MRWGIPLAVLTGSFYWSFYLFGFTVGQAAATSFCLFCLSALGISIFVLGPDSIPIGWLRCYPNRLAVVAANGAESASYVLDPSTSVTINYRGFENEQLTPRIRATGYDNFISFNDGPSYAFHIPDELTQEYLRTELRNWHLHKVQLKEYRRGGRTLLLYKEPTYEQLQQFKSELGVSLYS